MNSTELTIIVAAADQQAAQADMGDALFISSASPTGELPATHYFTSGFWLNSEIDKINNDVAWDSMIRCADWRMALAAEGLQMIVLADPA